MTAELGSERDKEFRQFNTAIRADPTRDSRLFLGSTNYLRRVRLYPSRLLSAPSRESLLIPVIYRSTAGDEMAAAEWLASTKAFGVALVVATGGCSADRDAFICHLVFGLPAVRGGRAIYACALSVVIPLENY